MLTTIKEPITVQAYLEAERKSERKNEFLNGEIFPMNGVLLNHNIITSKIATLLNNFLEDKDYIVCQSDMRMQNPVDDTYFYPDVVVIEGEAQLKEGKFDNVFNAVLPVEVLSPVTSG